MNAGEKEVCRNNLTITETNKIEPFVFIVSNRFRNNTLLLYNFKPVYYVGY